MNNTANKQSQLAIWFIRKKVQAAKASIFFIYHKINIKQGNNTKQKRSFWGQQEENTERKSLAIVLILQSLLSIIHSIPKYSKEGNFLKLFQYANILKNFFLQSIQFRANQKPK